MPPYSRHMLAAGRTAASSSLLRVLTPVILPHSIPATPTPTVSAKPTSHTITTSKRTLTTSPATHQEEQEEQPSQIPLPTPPTQQDLSTQIRLLMRQVPYPVAIITSTDPHAHAHTSASPSPSPSQPPSSPTPFRGMTVSSFNTVTLHPTPIISFNVRRPSETLTALQSSGRFLVHLLAPHPRTAALARDFSRGNRRLGILPAPETGGPSGGEEEEEPGTAGYEFAALPPSPVESETVSTSTTNPKDAHPPPLPLLRRRNPSPGSAAHPKDQEKVVDDFPFVFECRVLPQSIQVQDHTIVVGRVVRAITRPKHAGEAAATMRDHQVQQDAKDLCLTYADTRFWEMGKEI
ncbi:flavin reductase family protein [Aspergillus aculeatinus CBS 121060]|uniref:Uncharacterized protein n=1 Tax=Aspergillus aculeatinus CBS 121060 TaxID=1448322 RepID=A0ACD1HEV9_9EURO|nr:hypothetical protein BO66DRAFT_345570 [Aspergillus aculeatinus CBS 121060]RAH72123.1 hypothetical protein BO66DRAFT_345570 [Aspergillus aculeatinus CBS 121060]